MPNIAAAIKSSASLAPALLAIFAALFFAIRVWHGIWFTAFVDESEHLLGGKMLDAGATLYGNFVSQHGPVIFMLAQAYGALFGWDHPNLARLMSAALAVGAGLCVVTTPALQGRIERLWAAALFLGLQAAMWLMQAAFLVNYHTVAGFLLVAALSLFIVPAWLRRPLARWRAFAAGACLALVVGTAYSFGPCAVLLSASALWAAPRRNWAAFLAGWAAGALCAVAWMLRFADFLGYLAFHFAENQFVFSHYVNFSFGFFLRGLVPSFQPGARVHALGLLCCAGGFGLMLFIKGRMFFFEKKNQKTFAHLGTPVDNEHPQGRCEQSKSFLLLFLEKEGLSSFGPILLGYAALLALCARGGTMFQDGSFLISSMALFSIVLPAAFMLVTAPGPLMAVAGTILMGSFIIAAEMLGRHALNSPFGMDRAQMIAEPKTNIGLSTAPIYARIRELAPPGEHILSVPYGPGLYLQADRTPMERYFYYLPWDAAYARTPWFGQTHDLCADLPKAPPAVIYFDHWKVWNRWDMRDYMPCFIAFLNAHYRPDPDFPNVYARLDRIHAAPP
jgi:hypothetical protein